MLADREMDMTLMRVVMALAGALDFDQRVRTTTQFAADLAEKGRASEAADLLEDQLPGLDGRPDLQHAIEVALAGVTRLDPATRGRGAEVLEQLKHRVQDRGERDPHAMTIVAAELADAGDSADEVAFIVECALAYGVSSYDAVNTLILADRYESALHALPGVRDRDALVLRAALHLRRGDAHAAADDARAALALAAGRPLAEEQAAACLGEALG
jgi:hypothetical protein